MEGSGPAVGVALADADDDVCEAPFGCCCCCCCWDGCVWPKGFPVGAGCEGWPKALAADWVGWPKAGFGALLAAAPVPKGFWAAGWEGWPKADCEEPPNGFDAGVALLFGAAANGDCCCCCCCC